MEIIKENKCYVLPQTNTHHQITYQRHDLIWYPETGLPLLDVVNYKPFVKSVVTESPWVIACYDYKNVFIWEDGRWKHPNMQTYGASVSHIMMNIIGYTHTIPALVMDGGECIIKLKKELTESYIKSRK
jgi:hypothetical protein